MTTRTAEWIVKDYIADLKDPALCMRKDIFNQRSYSIWAAEEERFKKIKIFSQ